MVSVDLSILPVLVRPSHQFRIASSAPACPSIPRAVQVSSNFVASSSLKRQFFCTRFFLLSSSVIWFFSSFWLGVSRSVGICRCGLWRVLSAWASDKRAIRSQGIYSSSALMLVFLMMVVFVWTITLRLHIAVLTVDLSSALDES